MTRRPIATISGATALGAVAAFAILSSDVGAEPGATLLPNDPAIVAQGAQLYEAHCAACHGADLQGQPDWQIRRADGRLPAPPHDETGHTWHHPDEILIAITTHGTAALVGDGYESDMMGFGDVLSAADIIAVLSYIKSIWPDEVIEIHDQINTRAASGG